MIILWSTLWALALVRCQLAILLASGALYFIVEMWADVQKTSFLYSSVFFRYELCTRVACLSSESMYILGFSTLAGYALTVKSNMLLDVSRESKTKTRGDAVSSLNIALTRNLSARRVSHHNFSENLVLAQTAIL